jgi:bisphosphoglycerate-dependent phosphoglycerate mutase
LVKYLDHSYDEEILEIIITTRIPPGYDLDENLNVISKNYLGDQAAIKQLINSVKNQGKA